MEYARKSTVNNLKLQRDPMARDTAPLDTIAINEQSGQRFIQLNADPSEPKWVEIGDFLAVACRDLMSNESMIYKLRTSYERNKLHNEFCQDIGKNLEVNVEAQVSV
jgi:hypothetical protein